MLPAARTGGRLVRAALTACRKQATLRRFSAGKPRFNKRQTLQEKCKIGLPPRAIYKCWMDGLVAPQLQGDLGVQYIAANHGNKQAALRRVRFELLPKAINMGFQRMGGNA